MKTYTQKYRECRSRAFEKDLNLDNYNHVVYRAHNLIKAYYFQLKSEGYKNLNWGLESIKWNVQQAVINRDIGKTMIHGAIECVETFESIFEKQVGIEK